MTKVLVFDTETTGLIPNFDIYNIENTEIDKMPHIIQFSFIQYEIETDDFITFADDIIHLENVVLDEKNIKIHNITTKMINKSHNQLKLKIIDFMDVYKKSSYLIGHNINFDIKMLIIELIRLIKTDENKQLWINYYKLLIKKHIPVYCTMKNSVKICNIEKINCNGSKYLKYPNLCELYTYLFNKEPKSLHNSFYDCLYTLICYIKINYNYDVCKKNKTIKYIIKNIN